ncbi:MAG: ribonuclease III [Clostridiales bacterium]|jgi:ribonuclease-3|nr:ribonuclease III [Clostridiales bacterium]
MEKKSTTGEFENKIGYVFKDKSYIKSALTHSSASAKNNNERLEFVGDSILNFVIADYLMRNFNLSEGEMTARRKTFVNKITLAKAVEKNGLDKYLVTAGIKDGYSAKIKSSLFEAIVAAIYYDSGMEEAYDFILRFLEEYSNSDEKDYKSLLIEKAVKKHVKTAFPKYEYVTTEEKDDNGRYFRSSVVVNGKTIGSGRGGTKVEAEQIASKEALKNL